MGIRLLLSIVVPMIAAAYPIGQVVAVRYEQTAPGIFSNGSVPVSGRSVGTAFSAHSGVFSLEYFNGAKWVDFKAVCIDANEFLFGGTMLYYVQTLPANTTVQPVAPHAPPVFGPGNAARVENLRKLYTVGWTDAIADTGPGITTQEQTKSAAFQWAAWNVVRDTDLTVTNSGNDATNPVRITGSTTAQLNVRNQANAYLSAMNSLNPATVLSNLLIWTPVKAIKDPTGAVIGYERVAGQELVNPVPEPGFLALLGAGIAAVIFTKRRASVQG